MLQPYFKSGSLWFPDNDYWLTEMKNELAGVTRDEIKSEFIDCVDSLAMLCTQMRTFVARSEPRRERYNLSGSNSEYVFTPETV